jgi:hypothetical protein
MSDVDEGETVCVFWIGPVDHPLSHAHESEAKRCGAEFGNFGWYQDLEGTRIVSKTDKGYLETTWDALAERWHHVWTEYATGRVIGMPPDLTVITNKEYDRP